MNATHTHIHKCANSTHREEERSEVLGNTNFFFQSTESILLVVVFRLFIVFFIFFHIGYIQASRALMIASIVMGFFGIAATLAGMQCSKVAGENYVLKGRIAGTGGVFFILQGKSAP